MKKKIVTSVGFLLCVLVIFFIGYNNLKSHNSNTNPEVIANNMVWLTITRVSESLSNATTSTKVNKDELSRLLILYSSQSAEFTKLVGEDMMPIMQSGRATSDFLTRASVDGMDKEEFQRLVQISSNFAAMTEQYAVLYHKQTGEMNYQARDQIMNLNATIMNLIR